MVKVTITFDRKVIRITITITPSAVPEIKDFDRSGGCPTTALSALRLPITGLGQAKSRQ